jgi:alkylation response protein AidB-like acyl-CoA dehydrogenase
MGISMLLIDMKSAGLDVRPIMLLNGHRTTNEVFFDNVKVPAANLVGEAHKGWNYTRVVLGNERLSIARVGQSKRQLSRLKQLAATERDGDGRLIDQPLFRAKIAAAEIELMSVEAMSLRMLTAVQTGAIPGFEANMLKIKGSELQQRLAELITEAVGPEAMPFGEGADPDDPGSGTFKSYFDNRVVSIYGGSNEIQRNIIAKGMLGLGGRT